MKNSLKLKTSSKALVKQEVKCPKLELKRLNKIIQEQEEDLEEYYEAVAETSVLVAQQSIILRRLSKLIENLNTSLFITSDVEILEELISSGFEEDIAKEILENIKNKN